MDAFIRDIRHTLRENGVGIAVGALPGEVASLVLREGLRMTGVGIVIGLAARVGAARVLAGLLYEVGPGDPLTLGSVAVLFIAVSNVAILLTDVA